jgi:hypothetical protein
LDHKRNEGIEEKITELEQNMEEIGKNMLTG